MCVLLLFLGYSSKAQIAFGFSTSQDLYYKNANSFKRFYGVGFQYFIGENVSLNNRIMFGVNQDNKETMVHYGLGGLLTQAALSGGWFWSGASGNTFNELVGLVILPIIVPEGIQFHFGGDNLRFSPYIYPASFEYNTFVSNTSTLNDKEVKAILEVGTGVQIIVKDGLLISPSIGWKMRYGDKKQAISLGVMIAFINKD
jgi:outer membrane protein W